jgi:hypothetical protein
VYYKNKCVFNSAAPFPFSEDLLPAFGSRFFFVYFSGGLECVGHSFAYVAHFVFLGGG